MKKFLGLMLILSLVMSGPVLAKGKPDHANGGGKSDSDNGGGAVALSVCIDAGHGGSDPGSVNQEFRESELNLDVAQKLEALLEANGFKTHMTRNSDAETLSNNDRYSFCNATDASSLISIHHNGSTNSGIDYSLGLYHQGSSRNLATLVGEAVASEFNQLDSFRVDRFPSGILIKSDMPSMMSEGYFLTNTERLSQLRADYDGMVQREAQALLAGLLAYYER